VEVTYLFVVVVMFSACRENVGMTMTEREEGEKEEKEWRKR